jgi:hypothetical protein
VWYDVARLGRSNSATSPRRSVILVEKEPTRIVTPKMFLATWIDPLNIACICDE